MMQPVASGTWVPLAQAVDTVIDRLRPLRFRNLRKEIAMRKLSRRAVVSGLAPDAAPAAAQVSGEQLEIICRAVEHMHACDIAAMEADDRTPEGAALECAANDATEAVLAIAEVIWREPVRSPQDLLKRAMIARMGFFQDERKDREVEELGLFDRAEFELVEAVVTLLDQGAFGVQVSNRIARAE